jgi:hypothetical protein
MGTSLGVVHSAITVSFFRMMAVAEGIYEPFRALIDCSRDVIESPKMSWRSGELYVHIDPEPSLIDLYICLETIDLYLSVD